MLDPNAIAKLVEDEIKKTVAQQVQEAVSQVDWITDLENQIIKFVQDRITARFSNISTVPDLVKAVERSVSELFAQGQIPGIDNYIKQDVIKQAVDLAVEGYVSDTLEHLTLDQAWLTKIQNLINQRMTDQVSAKLSAIDVKKSITDSILENKDAILKGFIDQFQTNGIKDQANDTQLTVMDNVVVVENELVTQDLSVVRNTNLQGDLIVSGDLAIKGRINTDNRSWDELANVIAERAFERVKIDFTQHAVSTVLNRVKQGVDIDNVKVDGERLIDGDRLASKIQHSSLISVGTLNNLEVTGVSKFAGDTLNVKNNRVGINTEDPESALSVWDEEVSMTMSKYSKNTAFIGTARRQGLAIGVNRQNSIEVDADGVTTVQKIRIGRNSVSWATEPPGYSGTKGDIVYNTNVGSANDNTFAWMCLGAFKWQALKANK